MHEKVTIPATLEAVSKFTHVLEAKLTLIGTENCTLVILAVQELLVNIVRHAYDGDEGDIKFELHLTDQNLNIEISDQAMTTFEMPENIQAPDPLALPEHGMGLFIIHQSFDSVKYERLSGGNRWRLIKNLG